MSSFDMSDYDFVTFRKIYNGECATNSFVYHLIKALSRADLKNYESLKNAFPEFVKSFEIAVQLFVDNHFTYLAKLREINKDRHDLAFDVLRKFCLEGSSGLWTIDENGNTLKLNDPQLLPEDRDRYFYLSSDEDEDEHSSS